MSFLDFIPVVGKLLDRLLPDPAAAADAKLKLMQLVQTGELAQLQSETEIVLAGAANVKAEAESSSWMTSNWRPLTMLTFVGLIVARVFGWTAPNISEGEYVHLWNLIEIGLGGYVFGRSGEKIASSIAPAIASAVKK